MTYQRATLFAGGEPYAMPLLPERGFLPDLQAIPRDVIRRAKLLWLNYPSNPTAATAPVGFLTEAVEFARQHGLLLCHDAAYTQVTFEVTGAQPIGCARCKRWRWRSTLSRNPIIWLGGV
jgi:LL-diaminopimelate aminotransferase